MLGYIVEEIAGGEMVERLILRNTKTLEAKTLETEGVFIFVGQKPEVGFLDGCGEIKRSSGGWIVTDDKMETSSPGVFAAGDVREKFLRQVVTAAADGAIAAMAAFEYISDMEYLDKVLFGKPHAFALLISSIEPEHQALARFIESRKNTDKSVSVVDLYRSGRVRDKLGAHELPSMVEISDGKVVRIRPVVSAENIASFLGEAVR
jgi:thioredoxin reductase (NADPH)